MIRLTRKRLILTAVVLFILGLGLWITWEVCDWPPVRLIVKYGFPPAGGPTGRIKDIEGITFVEIKPGYVYVDRKMGLSAPSLSSTIRALIGLMNQQQEPSWAKSRWVQCQETIWIQRGALCFEQSESQYYHLASRHSDPTLEAELWGACRGLIPSDEFRAPSVDEVLFASYFHVLDHRGLEIEWVASDEGGMETAPVGPAWANFKEYGKNLRLAMDRVSPPKSRGFRVIWLPPKGPR